MKENKDINKAIAELEQVSGNERLRRIAELKEKYIRDEQASIEYAQDEGYKHGKEDGIAEGEARGKAKGKTEIAKKMLKKCMKIEDVIELTGLSQEEIEKLN